MDLIDLGTAPAGTGGDTLRGAFSKVNDNFSSLPLAIISSYTDSATFVLTDEYVRGDKATAMSLTVPPNSSVAFPIGKQLIVRNAGVGLITLVAGAGVTLDKPVDQTLVLRIQGSSVTLVQVSTDLWELSGDLTEV